MGISQPQLTTQTLKILAIFMSRIHDEISGAEVARATNLASGTLYPILMRLEGAGWVESRWEDENPQQLKRPRRRLYLITGVGIKKSRAAFREVVLSFKEFAWL
jgi:PadR family transcriptional regulator PadR